MTKVPVIVNVCICMPTISPVNVIVMPAGITTEQIPDGICPLVHIVASLNAPDLIAIKTVLDAIVVVASAVVTVVGLTVVVVAIKYFEKYIEKKLQF